MCSTDPTKRAACHPEIRTYQYGGTGMSIVDARIFLVRELYELDPNFLFVEDVWLSYMVQLAGWSIERLFVTFDTDARAQSFNQFSSLRQKKEMLFERVGYLGCAKNTPESPERIAQDQDEGFDPDIDAQTLSEAAQEADQKIKNPEQEAFTPEVVGDLNPVESQVPAETSDPVEDSSANHVSRGHAAAVADAAADAAASIVKQTAQLAKESAETIRVDGKNVRKRRKRGKRK